MLWSLTASGHPPLIIYQHQAAYFSFQKQIQKQTVSKNCTYLMSDHKRVYLQSGSQCSHLLAEVSFLSRCRGTLFWEDHINIPGLLSAKILVFTFFFFSTCFHFFTPQHTCLPHNQLLSTRLLWSSVVKALKTQTNICICYQWNSILPFFFLNVIYQILSLMLM